MNPIISIIIPSYKSGHSIFDVLTSLENQKNAHEYEIIVVDSTPGGLHKKIQSRFPHVQVMYRKEKTCPGVARNIGSRQARGDLFVFMDSDVYVDTFFLQKVQATFDSGKKIFSCALGIKNPFNILGWSNYLLEFNEFMPEVPGGERISIQSTCFIIPRTIFEHYDGFNEKFLFSEDFHFSTKLSNHGEKMYFEPAICVYHQNKGTIVSYFKKNYILGRYGAWVRRMYPLTGDSLLKRYPMLSACSGGYKFLSIVIKLFRCSKPKLLLFLLLSPFALINLLGYTLGFWEGNFEPIPDQLQPNLQKAPGH